METASYKIDWLPTSAKTSVQLSFRTDHFFECNQPFQHRSYKISDYFRIANLVLELFCFKLGHYTTELCLHAITLLRS